MKGLGMMTPARFALPVNGMGDLVDSNGFPLPANPVGRGPEIVSAAPDLTPADLNQSGCGCGCGMGSCGCGGGMGALDLAALENMLPGETFGVKNIYLAAAAVAYLIYSATSSSRRGR